MRLNTCLRSVADAPPQRERKVSAMFSVIKIVVAVGLFFSLCRASQAQDVVLDWNAHAANAIVGVANQPHRGEY
jgi:hypothetical protein